MKFGSNSAELWRQDQSEEWDMSISDGIRHIEARGAVAELIPGLLAGDTALLTAPKSGGKSVWLLNLLLHMAAGKPLPGLYDGNEPVKVFGVFAEHQTGVLVQMLQQIMNEAGFSPAERKLAHQNLRYVPKERVAADYLSSPAAMARVLERVLAHGARLVTIDTLSASYSLADENDAAEVGRVITKPLNQLAALTGAAVVLSHHTGVNGKSRGSSALSADMRVHYRLNATGGKRGNDQVITLDVVAAKSASIEPIGFMRKDGCLLLVHQGAAPTKAGKAKAESAQAKRNFTWSDMEAFRQKQNLSKRKVVSQFATTFGCHPKKAQRVWRSGAPMSATA